MKKRGQNHPWCIGWPRSPHDLRRRCCHGSLQAGAAERIEKRHNTDVQQGVMETDEVWRRAGRTAIEWVGHWRFCFVLHKKKRILGYPC